MSLTLTDIDSLLESCKGRDARAQAEVYNRYCRAMYNVALRIVKDEHYAEDVMQEGFLKAFTRLGDYRGEVAFGAWLKRIVVNHSIDFYKKNSRIGFDDFEKTVYRIEEVPEDDSTEDFSRLRAEQVLSAINRLRESYRMILTLHFIEGYDQEEICEILGIGYGNCRTTLSRAKESLRIKLQEIR